MLHKTIKLLENSEATLTTYVMDMVDIPGWESAVKSRPAIIILPGGAFSILTPTEAEPVALTFAKKGFHTFVLNYTVGEKCRFPDILLEVSKAIFEVRTHAEEWRIDPDGIAVMGFSAGACLAGVSATQWNKPGIAEALGTTSEMIRPDAAVIAYGAFDNSNTIQHDPEFFNPGAAKVAQDCAPELDMINFMGSHVSPLFLWHNREDKYVPVSNPLMAAAKMAELKLPFELHIFDSGEHGMSVCNSLWVSNDYTQHLLDENPNVAMWVPMCANWLKKLFGGAATAK